MHNLAKPAMRPARPEFSSGPTVKHPGWRLENLQAAPLGRSHRSKVGKGRLKEAIDRTREVLEVPDDFLIGVVPASDTGAVEMAMWSMLGPLPVQVAAWESFSKDWVVDIIDQLKLPNAEALTAPFGQLPDLGKVRPDADLVFAWNGTTSGVRVPNADFIAADRTGIVICDATSAAFAQPLDWAKLDVVTYSWQKVLGGEAAHGMLILSPRAVERLESYSPPWALPKLFRMTSKGKISKDIFEGSTINTPSMLCTEDYLDALKWVSSIGGLSAMYRRADENTAVLTRWAEKTPWIDFLAEDPKTRSNTGVCLKIVDSRVTALSPAGQAEFAKKLSDLLEKEGVALDAAAYRDAPPGLRIWCGGAVETSDLEALTPWLDWAFATVADELLQAA
ncbi:MAG TPA: phosphoserine transaminase [Caulobacteraceae bacterium]|jgi:phosphoserine aminotransferase|nr:phosphoserine transaminase [Caulobacteraceae bacterium]